MGASYGIEDDIIVRAEGLMGEQVLEREFVVDNQKNLFIDNLLVRIH